MTSKSMTGRSVLVTREQVGELGVLLEARGAQVIHAPLISIGDPEDHGVALKAQLDQLDSFDWLVVTSVEGADRTGSAAQGAPGVRLAAVGATSGRVLSVHADRAVDLIPSTQTADALARELVQNCGDQPQRFLVAQADIASNELCESLRSAGHSVTACVAYRTMLRTPDSELIAGADAVTFASGSAVRGWVDSVGCDVPDTVVVIGPSTAQIAVELGLKVSGIAADHTLEGLVTELERQFSAQQTQF